MDTNKTQIIQKAQQIIDELAEPITQELHELVLQEAEYTTGPPDYASAEAAVAQTPALPSMD